MTTPLPAPASVTPSLAGPAARQGNTAFATSVALLLIRLCLGWTFFFHGSQKLFGWFGGPGVEAFAGMLAKQNLPVLSAQTWAYIAACGEFFGGTLMLLGLLSRLASLPLIAVMFVAIANVHGKNGFSGPGGYEYNIALITLAVAILIAGPGLISLDALLFRRGFWARGPQPLSEPTTRR